MPFFSTLKFLNYEISIFFICRFESATPPSTILSRGLLVAGLFFIFLQLIRLNWLIIWLQNQNSLEFFRGTYFCLFKAIVANLCLWPLIVFQLAIIFFSKMKPCSSLYYLLISWIVLFQASLSRHHAKHE